MAALSCRKKLLHSDTSETGAMLSHPLIISKRHSLQEITMAFARTPTVQKPAKKTFADRYMIVPCETESDLAVIWDRQEEQVVDVISASTSRYTNEDALWDEFHTPPFNARSDWRMAA